MSRLMDLTPSEKRFLDDALVEAGRVKGKKLNRPEKNMVLRHAREQIEGQRYAAKIQAVREQDRNEAEFTWSKPRPFRR